MGFELFTKKKAKGGPPRVTITKYNNFVLNSTVMDKYFRQVKYVHLLWDADQQRVGIKPAPKQDQAAYQLNLSAKGNVATVSGISFLRHIGWHLESETTSFETEWNDREGLLEFLIGDLGKRPKRLRAKDVD